MLFGENSRKTKKRKILRECSSLAHAHLHARGYCAWRSVCRGGSMSTLTRARYKRSIISGSLRLGLCLCCHKASPTRFIVLGGGLLGGSALDCLRPSSPGRVHLRRVNWLSLFSLLSLLLFFCQTFLFVVSIPPFFLCPSPF